MLGLRSWIIIQKKIDSKLLRNLRKSLEKRRWILIEIRIIPEINVIANTTTAISDSIYYLNVTYLEQYLASHTHGLI